MMPEDKIIGDWRLKERELLKGKEVAVFGTSLLGAGRRLFVALLKKSDKSWLTDCS